MSTTILLVLVGINFHFLLFVQSNDSYIKKFLKNTDGFKSSFIQTEHINDFSLNNSITTIHPIVYPLCQTQPGSYSNFYTDYYSWMDSFVFSFIPFIIMIICNTALIKRVFSTKRNLYKNVSKINENNELNQLQIPNKQACASFQTSPLVETKSLLNLNENKATSAANISETCNGSNKLPNKNSLNFAKKSAPSSSFAISKAIANSDSIEKMRNMAITIIGVTILFIIFTVPINVYVPIMHATHASNTCDDLIFCILNNMVNANHSINFFIYLTTNSKFKNELKVMLAKFKTALLRYVNLFSMCCECSASKLKQNKNSSSNVTSSNDSKKKTSTLSITSQFGRTTINKSKQFSVSQVFTNNNNNNQQLNNAGDRVVDKRLLHS